MSFRSIKKEPLGATVPADLLDTAIAEARRLRVSRSALATLALCQFLDHDPRAYGLDRRAGRRVKKAVPAP